MLRAKLWVLSPPSFAFCLLAEIVWFSVSVIQVTGQLGNVFCGLHEAGTRKSKGKMASCTWPGAYAVLMWNSWMVKRTTCQCFSFFATPCLSSASHRVLEDRDGSRIAFGGSEPHPFASGGASTRFRGSVPRKVHLPWFATVRPP